MVKRYVYVCLMAMLITSMAFGGEVRKLTQEDVEWLTPPYLGNATVTSAGGHVGHPFINAPEFDVRAYGAVGDGVTDDTAAINLAKAAAIAADGVLYFPKGTYQISSALDFDNVTNLTIRGDGSGISYIRVTDDITAFNFTGVSYNVQIKGLWIGSASARTAGYGISIVGTNAIHANDFIIDDVRIQNAYHGLLVDYTDRTYIDGLTILNSVSGGMADGIIIRRSYGLYATKVIVMSSVGTFASDTLTIDSDTDTIEFSQSSFSQAGAHGIHLQNTLGGGLTDPRLIKFNGVSSELALGNGYHIEASRDTRITNGESALNTGTGYSVSGGVGVTIVNSLALENESHGFYTDNGTGIQFIGCTASTNGTAAAQSGFYLNNDGVRLIGSRSGNVIFPLSGAQGIGLTIVNGKGKNIILGNDFDNNSVSAVVNAGLSTNIIHNNVGYVTENGGLSSAIASGATIAHGLAAAPTIVHVTAAENAADNVYVSADATNLTVTYDGGGTKTFYWEAKVGP